MTLESATDVVSARSTSMGLPFGWTEARIGDLFESWGGLTPSTEEPTYWGGDIPWISSKDVKGWRLSQGTERISQKALRENRLRLCPKGSVLVVVRSGILAHTFPVAVADAEVVINQDMKAFVSPDASLNEWLALGLRAMEPEILAENRKDGTTVQSIRFDQLKDKILPVPPLADRKRIVAQIEALLSRVNAARARLAKVPAIMKRFRQAVLAAACSGRLTEGWRTRQADAESAARSDEDSDGLFDLPESWTWRSAGSALLDACYGTSAKCGEQDRGVPVLRIPNIVTGLIDTTNLKYAPLSATELKKLKVEVGDVVVCRTNGSLDLIGKAAIIPKLNRPHAFASYLIRLRLDPALYVPAYFHHVLSGPVGRGQIEGCARTTAGQFNLNLEILRNLRVPTPPMPEQHEIVRRVDALFKLADGVEGRVKLATARADRLTQAALAKAFRGELVPPNTDSSGGRK